MMKNIWIVLLIIFSIPCNAAPLEYQSQERSFRSHPLLRSKQPFVAHRFNRTVNAEPRVRLTRNLPSINQVFIKGGVNLEIIGGQAQNKISIKRVYQDLSVKVCDGAIYIHYARPVSCNQNPRPCIRLYIRRLNHLVVAGDSVIKGSHLDTYCGLTIEHCGCGQVCITGPTEVVRIVNSGAATICIPCVTSEHLHILATGSGCVKLRGHVGLLLVRAFQQSTVDTRFMRSRTALVQATDAALVTVKTTDVLRAFASGMSNIYYYTQPGDLLQHNLLSGNVFQM